jgi:hypothetical protein
MARIAQIIFGLLICAIHAICETPLSINIFIKKQRLNFYICQTALLIFGYGDVQQTQTI